MPSFQYTGRDAAGALVSGQLQAVSADAAAADLFSSSITPIEISERRKKTKESSQEESFFARANAFVGGGKVGITELIIFSRQMFSLNKAGMPLDRALRGLEASINSIAMKKILRSVAAQLEKGMDLSSSLGRHPEVFSPLYLSLVHVGENTGRLDLSFQQIGKYLELERNTSKQIKSATRYPMFVMVAISVALAIITVFVIPVFADTFKKLGAELPWQTTVLINISNFVVNYWPYMVVLLIGAFVGFKQYVKTEKGELVWDKKKLGLPLIGNIFERVALSRFSRTFAMMMKAGVPVVQSMGVVAQAVGNKYIGKNVLKMREGISHGESLYQCAVKSDMFSPLILQMIAVGEESGSVDELLEEVADFYDQEVEYDLAKLGAAIEPILIVCIGGMVLVLALGVFLPIWDLANAAR